MNNTGLAHAEQKSRFSVAIKTEQYQRLINDTLGDPNRAKRFVAAITSAVAVNPALQDCSAGTVLAGALLGEALNLSPSPQLGQYYLVPFKLKAKYDRQGKVLEPESVKAQFVLGYKGYIQLAIRSGQYKKLNVLEIKQGELLGFNALTEEIQCSLINDWEEREAAPTIGYYAAFEYINGFRKAVYWSRDKMEAHADKYSPAFNRGIYHKILNNEIPDKDLRKYSSFWYKNFDDMARKTLLRHLISRWGIMSTELQAAFEQDGSLNEIGRDNKPIVTPEYELPIIPDNTPAIPESSEPVEDIDIEAI